MVRRTTVTPVTKQARVTGKGTAKKPVNNSRKVPPVQPVTVTRANPLALQIARDIQKSDLFNNRSLTFNPDGSVTVHNS